MPSQPRVLGLVVALTLLVAGGVLATGQYHRLSGYESTTATIERAQIQAQYTDGFDSDGANSPAARTQQPELGLRDVVYRPNVSYAYSVDGERYTGANVAAGTDIVTDNRSDAAALLPARRAGATTTVYYDPANPDDSHLLHRYRFFPGGLLLVAGLLVLTDTLTNLRVVRFLTGWVPFAVLERVPGVERTALSEFPDDPTEILDSLDRWEGTGPSPVRAGASPAVWVLCYLFIADLAIGYVAISSRPYDLWAVVPFLAVATGLMRLGFHRLDT